MSHLKYPSDVASVDAVVEALYEYISFPPGARPDWDRMRSLYLPSAQIIPSRRETCNLITVMHFDSFRAWAEPYIEESGWNARGFYECDAGHTIEIFGDIAHILSVYEARNHPEETPFKRGINSIQLVRDGDGWLVASIIWDMESAEWPIPERLLKQRS